MSGISGSIGGEGGNLHINVVFDGFKEFQDQFSKYTDELKNTTKEWAKTTDEFRKLASAMSAIVSQMGRMRTALAPVVSAVQTIDNRVINITNNWNTFNTSITRTSQTLMAVSNTTNIMTRNVDRMAGSFRALGSVFGSMKSSLAFFGIPTTIAGGLSLVQSLSRSAIDTQRVARGWGWGTDQMMGFQVVGQNYFANPMGMIAAQGAARYDITSPQRRAYQILFGNRATSVARMGPAGLTAFMDAATARLSGFSEEVQGTMAERMGFTGVADLNTLMSWKNLKGPDREAAIANLMTATKKVPGFEGDIDNIRKANDQFGILSNTLKEHTIKDFGDLAGKMEPFLVRLGKGDPEAKREAGNTAVTAALLGGFMTLLGRVAMPAMGAMGGGIMRWLGGALLGTGIGALLYFLMTPTATAAEPDMSGRVAPGRERFKARDAFARIQARRKALEENNKALGLGPVEYGSGDIAEFEEARKAAEEEEKRDKAQNLLSMNKQTNATDDLTKSIYELIDTLRQAYGLGGGGGGGPGGTGPGGARRGNRGGGGGATEIGPTKISKKADIPGAMKILTDAGMTTKEAAAMVGEGLSESGLQPLGVGSGDAGAASGMFQWHRDRWNPLVAWARSQGINPATREGQLKMAAHEYITKYRKRLGPAIERAQSAHDIERAMDPFEAFAGYQYHTRAIGVEGVRRALSAGSQSHPFAGAHASVEKSVSPALTHKGGEGPSEPFIVHVKPHIRPESMLNPNDPNNFYGANKQVTYNIRTPPGSDLYLTAHGMATGAA